MSQLIARILLSMLMFPVAVLVAIIAALIGDAFLGRAAFNSYREREYAIAIFVAIISWIFMAIYWVLLWRKIVRWNSTRITATIVAVPVIIVFCVFIAAVIESAQRGLGLFIGCVSAPLLWVFTTIFIWRETARERAHRIKSSSTKALVCPTCGYNLTGLSEARCPECGTRFTLDELLAAQPGHEAREIETT